MQLLSKPRQLFRRNYLVSFPFAFLLYYTCVFGMNSFVFGALKTWFGKGDMFSGSELGSIRFHLASYWLSEQKPDTIKARLWT